MIQKMKLSNLIMLNIISQTMKMMNLEIEARKIPAGPKWDINLKKFNDKFP